MADSVALPAVAGREAARTPLRFRDRVILAFRDPANIEYLRGYFAQKIPAGPMRDFCLDTLADSVYEYSNNYGRALEILADDPYERRDGVRPAVNLWGEVRRLNRVYYQERLDFLHEHAALLERVPYSGMNPTGLRDGISEDDEQYHYRMFEADSLRPDGWSHLNGSGPLYAILEDQAKNVNTWPDPRRAADPGDQAWSVAAARQASAGHRPGSRAPQELSKTTAVSSARETMVPQGPRPSRGAGASARASTSRPPIKEGFAGRAQTRERFAGGMSNWPAPGPAPAPPPGGWGHGYLGEPKPEPLLWVPAFTDTFLLGSPDAPWSDGNPQRTPEQAVFEYWGDDGKMATEDGVAWEGSYGDDFNWGDWSQSTGTRFMRYETIPFWQKGGHDGYELDIEETLGVLMRETDNPVRRWDLDRLRNPRGQEYRRYGARSGHMT